MCISVTKIAYCSEIFVHELRWKYWELEITLTAGCQMNTCIYSFRMYYNGNDLNRIIFNSNTASEFKLEAKEMFQKSYLHQ